MSIPTWLAVGTVFNQLPVNQPLPADHVGTIIDGGNGVIQVESGAIFKGTIIGVNAWPEFSAGYDVNDETVLEVLFRQTQVFGFLLLDSFDAPDQDSGFDPPVVAPITACVAGDSDVEVVSFTDDATSTTPPTTTADPGSTTFGACQ